MTVAYACFRYLIDRENHNSIVYYFTGPTDVKLIGDDSPSREDWDDMEKSAEAQGVESTEKNDPPAMVEVSAEKERPKRYIPDFKKMKSQTNCDICVKVVCFGFIVISMLTCIATKVYDTDQSNRLVGIVILAVTSAATISMCIYATVTVTKKRTKPIHATSVVLFILVVIQALIAGVSVRVSERDELMLGQSLSESFKLAKEDNPRHVKLWAATQSDLNCCGVYGPDDYRTPHLPHFFPPNVPISCCPTYNRAWSAFVQEREREICKAKKAFYVGGCKRPVVNLFKESADVMLSVIITLVIIEILIAIIGAGCLVNRRRVKKIVVTNEE